MSSTTFSNGTVILPTWLNDVNSIVYGGNGGALGVGFTQTGTGAVLRLVSSELKEVFTPQQFGALGDGTTDDTAAIQRAIDSLPARGHFFLPTPTVSYKISSKINFINKPGCVFDFNNAFIDASSFSSAQTALYFKGISEAIVRNIFIIGNTTNVSSGVEFDADVSNITIHAQIDKIHASSCNIGVKFGNSSGFQFSDNNVGHIYGSDSNIGIYCTGSNSLAMKYAHLEAYNNSQYGVLLEQGGGTIDYLEVAHNTCNIWFGKTSGANHNTLNRWDILGGYSEEAITNEVFIGSAACSDTNPFRESITIRNFRCTPFTSTNQQNFIQWNLNGDLILADMTFTSGTQTPQVLVASNNAYRKARVVFDRGIMDMDPPGSSVGSIIYSLANPGQVVDINDVRCNNTLTTWQNAGAVNPGTMIRGIDTRKVREYNSALLGMPGMTLAGAWDLRDLTSGTAKNLVLGGPDLSLSMTAQPQDQWFDDGLVGFYKYASNSSKNLSASNSKFAVGTWTIGAILRCGTSGVDETNWTSLGDVINSGAGNGLRIGIGNTGTAFIRGAIGGVSVSVVPDNGYDPHSIICSYVPSTSLTIYAVNLRTGNVVTATNTTSIPATGALTWANSISFRNDNCVRGHVWVAPQAITAATASNLNQRAMQLTDNWKLA